MRGSSTLRFLTTLATLVTIACGGGGGDDSNNGNNGNPAGPNVPGATNGSFKAVINGTQWNATGQVLVSRQQNNFIGIAAAGSAGSTTYSVVLGIANATGPGTHSFALTAGGDGSSLIIGGVSTGWGTAFNGGLGNVTITSLSANRIVGTFSGTAVPSSGTASNLVVTSGTFDISF